MECKEVINTRRERFYHFNKYGQNSWNSSPSQPTKKSNKL